MEKLISVGDAKRRFSQVLREVKEGRSYVVTSRGRPVARIEPVKTLSKGDAKCSLLARLESLPVRRIGSWNRNDLYE